MAAHIVLLKLTKVFIVQSGKLSALLHNGKKDNTKPLDVVLNIEFADK